MNYQTLRYEHADHVVTLTYDRPEQHNAVNRTMNAELHHAWQRFRDDDDAFVLVITGAGETTFCAGWDLQDAASLERLRIEAEMVISMFLRPDSHALEAAAFKAGNLTPEWPHDGL
jgi:enoyl-CoA hydratase/carnithine racemase